MAVITTSGVFTASQTVITLVNAALRLAQVIGSEETATGAQLENSLDAMTAMCKGWQASGIHVWCEEEGILFLQPNQTQYKIGAGSPDHVTLFDTLVQTSLTSTAAASTSSLVVGSIAGVAFGDNVGVQLDSGMNFWTTVSAPPTGSTVVLAASLPSQASAGALVFDYTVPLYRPLRVMGGRRYNLLSKIDIPMQVWARLDYEAQPNKYTTGTPTAFFYDPQMGNGPYFTPTGLWNSWPTPQNNTNAARFTAQRPIQAIGTLANIPDFPDEWNAALKWNLALEIGPENGCPMEQMQIIGMAAKKWYDMASQWDRESESVMFGVAFTPGQRRG
jgi:hypothetical protein